MTGLVHMGPPVSRVVFSFFSSELSISELSFVFHVLLEI